MPDWPYDDMRTLAIISKLMILHGDNHNRRMADMVSRRLGKPNPPVHSPIMDRLQVCMEAFAGELGRFDYGERNVMLAMSVILNDMKEIKFDIIEK